MSNLYQCDISRKMQNQDHGNFAPSSDLMARLISSEFLRTIVPRIAYSNPAVQFDIQPLKDPRGAEKSKDPKDKSRNPDWQLGEARPIQEMVVSFSKSPFARILV
jgi:hypothetical protein